MGSTEEDYSACIQGFIDDPSDCDPGQDTVESTLHMGDACSDHGFTFDCGAFAEGSWTESEDDCNALLEAQ